MINNAIIANRYTEEGYMSAHGDHQLFLLVQPGTDIQDRFKAWDTVINAFIMVNGWHYDESYYLEE